MKKLIVLAALLVVLAPFVIFAGGQSEQKASQANQKPTLVKIVTSYPRGDENYFTAHDLASRIKALGKGMFTVQVFDSGSMGGEKQTVQAVKMGAAQFVTCGLLPITMFTTKYGFFDGVYVFKNFAQWQAVWNSKIGQRMKQVLLENNLTTVGVYPAGMRQIAANVPIVTPKDAAGIKIRIPQIPSRVAIFKALGFLPTPISLPELFSAMQTGVVNAADGPPSQMLAYNYDEVEHYLIMSDHNIAVQMLLVNSNFLKSLGSDKRAIVEQAAKEAVSDGATYAAKNDQADIQKLVDSGMKKIIPNRAAFEAAALPAVKEEFKTLWTGATWQEINSYAK